MTLKSLVEFNSGRAELWNRMNDDSPRSNGIACPECGNELMDSFPNITLTSYPPKKNVHCPSCKYTGYRVE